MMQPQLTIQSLSKDTRFHAEMRMVKLAESHFMSLGQPAMRSSHETQPNAFKKKTKRREIEGEREPLSSSIFQKNQHSHVDTSVQI